MSRSIDQTIAAVALAKELDILHQSNERRPHSLAPLGIRSPPQAAHSSGQRQPHGRFLKHLGLFIPVADARHAEPTPKRGETNIKARRDEEGRVDARGTGQIAPALRPTAIPPVSVS